VYERLRRFLQLRDGEPALVAWAFVYFLSLLCSYYILRPIRDERGLVGGVENLPWLFTATFVAMAVLVPLFGWITSRFPRSRFLPAVYIGFLCCLLGFYVSFRLDPSSIFAARVFFVWLSVFNLFVVSVFWSFMADVCSREQSERLFGLIAAGGTTGALLGPLLTTALVGHIGASALLLISAAFLAVALLSIRAILRWQQVQSGLEEGAQPTTHALRAEQPLGGGLWDGLLLIARSPYLAGVGLLIVLLTLLATFLYFQQAEIVRDAFASRAERTAAFSAIDLATNALALFLQIFVTGRVMRRWGVAVSLSVLPLLLMFGFVALALAPTFFTLAIVQVVRRAGNYALMRPAREALYVVLTREEKYKAKNVIDTLVYRGGDAFTGWLYAGLRSLGASLAAVAWIAVPVAAGWAALAYTLGKAQARRAASDERRVAERSCRAAVDGGDS